VIPGEIVAVQAMRQRPKRSRQRQDRRLYEIEARRIVIHPVQLFRVNQVFGVVDDHYVELRPSRFLLDQQMLKSPVQAIGLRRRSVVRNRGQMNVGETLRDASHRGLRFRIIGINAREDLVAVAADRSEIVFQHLADHSMLFPQRNEYHDPAPRRGVELALAGREQARRGAEFVLQPGECPEQIHCQVVQALTRRAAESGASTRRTSWSNAASHREM